MATRTIWQDLYGIQLDLGSTLSAHLANVSTRFTMGATKVGVQGTGAAAAKFGLPLTDHPNFKSPSGTVDTEQARGISERQVSEFNTVQTGDAVEFALPVLGNSYNVAAFACLFFQSGASEGAGATGMKLLSCNPYDTADTDNFAYFTRIMQPSAAGGTIDLVVHGGLCNALTIGSEAGQLCTVEATIGASTWEQTNAGAGGYGVTANLENSFADEIPLKHQDMNCFLYDTFTDFSAITATTLADCTFAVSPANTLASAATDFAAAGFVVGDTVSITSTAGTNDGNYTIKAIATTLITFDTKAVIVAAAADTVVITKIGEWVDVQVPTWSVSMTNNAQFNYYNDDAISGIHLGRLNVEGSFTMPFSQDQVGENYVISRFLTGDAVRMSFGWGVDGANSTGNEAFDLGATATTTWAPDRYKNDATATNPKNFLAVVVNARVTDYEVTGDNELQVECTFQGVRDYSPTDAPNGESEYRAVQVFCQYSDSKLVSGA